MVSCELCAAIAHRGARPAQVWPLLQEVQVREATAHSPLLSLPEMRDENGSSLPVGKQLRRVLQLQVTPALNNI